MVLLINLSSSSATIQFVPSYFKIFPFAAPVVLTLERAPIFAAAIRASALAFVKY